ncbi:MAG TPA: hypothetical protein VH475_20135 [Tepidisphaeraceae bacterium]|jgi:hypothetical protein
MKTRKSLNRARRERELMVLEIERVLVNSKRILTESKLEVERVRRQLAYLLR